MSRVAPIDEARLPHAQHAVAVEASGLAGLESDAVVGDADRGPVAVAAIRDLEAPGPRMALGVGDRLLDDPPQLALLEERQPVVGVGLDGDLHPGSFGDPLGVLIEDRREARILADVGAKVVQRVAYLADDPPYVVPQLVEGRPEVGSLRLPGDDPIEFERQVGE